MEVNYVWTHGHLPHLVICSPVVWEIPDHLDVLRPATNRHTEYIGLTLWYAYIRESTGWLILPVTTEYLDQTLNDGGLHTYGSSPAIQNRISSLAPIGRLEKSVECTALVSYDRGAWRLIESIEKIFRNWTVLLQRLARKDIILIHCTAEARRLWIRIAPCSAADQGANSQYCSLQLASSDKLSSIKT